MDTFIEVQPRNFIYFSLERSWKLILDGIHNKSKIKEGFRGKLIRWRLQLWNSEKYFEQIVFLKYFSHGKINKTLRDTRKKVKYHNQQIELSPLSQLISGFGSISVVLSSSLIS